MLSKPCKLELVSPAKVNLSLAVLGKQEDGFHALHSVVVQTDFGDHVGVEWNPASTGKDRLLLHNTNLPETDNTLWKALQLFRWQSGCMHGQFTIRLDKHIPVGAGLGGGSSNGVAVLRALRSMFTDAVGDLNWSSMAAEIGSDCPLFFSDEPVLMQGRGERITPLGPELANRVRGEPLILFKPPFSINTGEAYARLAAARLYQTAAFADKLTTDWQNSGSRLPPCCNAFEYLLADWMPSLAVVLACLRKQHQLDARLSGSGSACFVFPNNLESAMNILRKVLEDAWGSAYWMRQTFVK